MVTVVLFGEQLLNVSQNIIRESVASSEIYLDYTKLAIYCMIVKNLSELGDFPTRLSNLKTPLQSTDKLSELT